MHRYRFADEGVLLDSLVRLGATAADRALVDAWLEDFARDPIEKATRIPGTVRPVFQMRVPRTEFMVTYQVFRDYGLVTFFGVERLPFR